MFIVADLVSLTLPLELIVCLTENPCISSDTSFNPLQINGLFHKFGLIQLSEWSIVHNEGSQAMIKKLLLLRIYF